MKTTEIITAQFKHINSNIKEYFKMALPLIIGITFIFSADKILDYAESQTETSVTQLVLFVFVFLIIIYTAFYFFRNYINLHRFIILQDTSNYYSPIKKFKITLIYFLYFLLYIFSALIVMWCCIILYIAFPNLVVFEFAIAWMLLFTCGFVYPFFGLALPQIAIGEKISLKKTFKESKGARETLFYQFLIIYIPLYFIDRILKQQTALEEYFLYNLISASITAYATALFVGCLSRTYVLWKETNKSEKNN
jgi:hypothetical protein|tara:strand:+ start:101 stop:853 length:753 start_codon:yes stop_codon:yes gene_type:complete